MFPSASLVSLALSFATSVIAAPGLSLKVDAPSTVNGVDNLKVVTTVTNTGDETLKVLNHPLSPLTTLQTDTFTITQKGSNAVPGFTGIKAKYNAAKAAEVGAFTSIAPGQSVTLTHDLSNTYNFTSTGAGEYTFAANPTFDIVQADGSVSAITADVVTSEAKLSGKLVAPRPTLRKRGFNGCTINQQEQVYSAINSAKKYAAESFSYLNSNTAATTRYTTWFGEYTDSRHSTALSHFNNLNNGVYRDFTYDCTCDEAGTYAYVYPDQYGTIYLCPVFWTAPVNGTDSKGGTLIHESSHFTKNGGTDDYVYGQTGAKSLAKSNPDEAVMNADSHEYFAENNPALS